MHCSCNTSVESFYRLNINAQKVLQVIPIPVDSGRADLTAGCSVTAHDFFGPFDKGQRFRNPETQKPGRCGFTSHGLRCQGSHLPLLLSVQTLKICRRHGLRAVSMSS